MPNEHDVTVTFTFTTEPDEHSAAALSLMWPWIQDCITAANDPECDGFGFRLTIFNLDEAKNERADHELPFLPLWRTEDLDPRASYANWHFLNASGQLNDFEYWAVEGEGKDA